MSETKKVLFVCLGNSCRSPMAESVLRSFAVDNNNLFIDSAAIADWNVGRSPEPRCIQVLAEHNMTSDHITRQISDNDFLEFDYIFGMDDYNIEDLKERAPQTSKAKILLLGEYDYNKPNVIPDPYFDRGIHGFRSAYEQIYRSCKNFYQDEILQNKV
ncbi:low molecular weight phosphotyrosine protein phosphatase 1-like isoform X2 [Bradysia coprophila]|uniref:low molecular weight phosphotyrosine protein phosphatase 1-like isoform X2 n=1 Tax=Bradysia coprophila TaxID=38358 RepID=UPI00187DD128|nr:low molecular weight phosphotyrosine protein phosphatase 1-like isoform X2 [Bradysia coprophila]